MIDLNQALCENDQNIKKKQHKEILFHNNAPLHTAKLVKETNNAFISWKILSHASYSQD